MGQIDHPWSHDEKIAWLAQQVMDRDEHILELEEIIDRSCKELKDLELWLKVAFENVTE